MQSLAWDMGLQVKLAVQTAAQPLGSADAQTSDVCGTWIGLQPLKDTLALGLHRSGVSTTPQRLWPAAPWTGNASGTEERENICCSMQPGHHRHGHLLSTSQKGQGLFTLLRSP